MKISKAIEMLQEYLDKYGDITLLCNDIDYCYGPVEIINPVYGADNKVYAITLD